MKVHYFEQDAADADDIILQMSIGQGYVPSGCLMVGQIVMGLINKGDDPCRGCEGPREKCGGRAKSGSR